MTKHEAICTLSLMATELVGELAGTDSDESNAKLLKRYIDSVNMAISALRQQEQKRTSADCKHGESCKCGADVECCCDDCSAFEPVTNRNGLIIDDIVPEMTLDDAIAHLDDTLSDTSRKWSCESCRLEHVQLRAWLAELRDIKQKRNDHLTLDELRQMDGKPVWTVTTGISGSGRWELCTCETVCACPLHKVLRCVTADGEVTDYDLDTYGKTWMAYRQKPEES